MKLLIASFLGIAVLGVVAYFTPVAKIQPTALHLRDLDTTKSTVFPYNRMLARTWFVEQVSGEQRFVGNAQGIWFIEAVASINKNDLKSVAQQLD